MGGLRLDLSLSLSGGASFSPSSLFAASEAGGWYDPSDLSTLFQNSNGTGAVTADGDPVGYMADKSGNGNHLTQATAADRPILRSSGGRYWLEFDGASDYLVFPINIASGWTSGTGLFAAKIATDPPAAACGPVLGYFGPVGGELHAGADGLTLSAFLSSARKDALADPGNLTAWHTMDFRSAANDFKMAFNGADFFTTTTNTVSATSGVAGFPDLGRSGTPNFFAGTVGRVIVINRVLSGGDLSDARNWIAGGYGGTI